MDSPPPCSGVCTVMRAEAAEPQWFVRAASWIATAVVAVLWVSGCVPVPPQAAAISRWERVVGPVPERCADRVWSMPVSRNTFEYVSALCGVPAWGCTTGGGRHVTVVDGAGPRTVEHELLHVLEYCITHQGTTGTHSAEIWRGLHAGDL